MVVWYIAHSYTEQAIYRYHSLSGSVVCFKTRHHLHARIPSLHLPPFLKYLGTQWILNRVTHLSAAVKLFSVSLVMKIFHSPPLPFINQRDPSCSVSEFIQQFIDPNVQVWCRRKGEETGGLIPFDYGCIMKWLNENVCKISSITLECCRV